MGHAGVLGRSHLLQCVTAGGDDRAAQCRQAWSAAKNYPVYLGEFGAYSKADEA